MAYQALYRKWRPSVFEDVVSQNHIVDTLKNQINTNKIAHAYLFCGSRGTGKTSTAKIFSRAVNCEHPVNGNPCNECDTCKGILNNSIFDVVEIDGASNNKVDDIRNIRDEVVYPPADSKYKVYIIDEVHMLTTEAFNALLKTLEEPPHYVIFILATTEFHKIPATIISRCQKFDFKRITYKDTAERIKKVAESDNIKITDSAVKLIAKVADGSLRDGLSKLDQCLALGLEKIDYMDVANIIGASDPKFLADFCDSIIDENLGQALKLLDDGINMGIDALRLYGDVTDYFRDLLMIKTSKDYSLIVNTEEEVVKKYEEQCSKLSLPRILKIIENLFEGQNIAKYLASPKLSFETVLLKIASKNTNTDTENLLERINILEEKLDKIMSGAVVVSDNIAPKEKNEEQEIQSKKDAPIFQETEEKTDEPENEPFEIEKTVIETEEISFSDEELKDVEPEFEDEEYVFDSGEDEGFEEADFVFPGEYTAVEIPSKEVFNETDVASTKDFGANNEVLNVEETSFFVEDSANEEQTQETGSEELADIAINFKEIISQMKNKDMGFDMIMKSASVSVKDNALNIEFENKTSYDIAKANKYDELLTSTVKEIKGLDISVKLKNIAKEKKITESVKKDPLDDIIEIAEQNQIIFNFEE